MRARSRFLIAGSTLSQLGNWVNVTAVMIMLQQREGAALVAVYFLSRTIAPYFLSRPLVGCVPDGLVGRAWASSQAALVMIMFVLVLCHRNTSLLITLLAVAGVLQSATSSWLMHIAERIDPDHRKPLITAISTGTSVAIVAGPGLGGFLAGWEGLPAVFLFDSVTFAASLLLVPWRRLPVVLTTGGRLKRSAWHTVLSSLMPIKPQLNLLVWPLVATWLAFGLFGGLFTAIEMPVFSLVKGFNADQIGLAISAYGLGGIVVFVASTFFGFSNSHLSASAVALVGVIAWVVGAGVGLHVAFFVAGLGFALVNSSARVAFGEIFAESKVPSSEAWAWVNQLSLATSVVAYAAAWLYFVLTDNIQGITWVVVGLGAVCVTFGICWDVLTNRTRDRKTGEFPITAP